jgi:hypothetical protein
MSPKSFLDVVRRQDVSTICEKDLIQLLDSLKGRMHDPDDMCLVIILKLLLNETFGHQHKIYSREVKLDVRERKIQP